MGPASAPQQEVAFVRTVLRVTAALVGVTLVLNVSSLLSDAPWQRVVMLANSSSLLFFITSAVRRLREGRADVALERIFQGGLLVETVSVPLSRGTHTQVAVALSVFVLSTGSRVLPPARTTRWVYAAVAVGLLTSLFDVIALPTQVVNSGTEGRGFLAMVFVALGIFAVLLIHQFPRYPVGAKLTVGFLAVALAPLLIFAAAASSLVPHGHAAHLTALAAAAGASVVAFFFSQVIAAPLSQVADAMDRFTAGEGTVRARVRSRDEIGAVAERFNALAARIDELLGSLRREVAQRTAKEAELQALNAALEMARDRADAGSRAKSSFLAQMSHELRTPLNAVIGYTEMIAEEAESSGHAEIQADAARVTYAARHLLGLIDDILDLSKIEAGQAELTRERFDALALARATADAAMPLIAGNGNAFELKAGASALEMYSDPRKLRQALFNLLSNAAKFTRDRRVTLEVRGEPAEAPTGAVFAVRDEGIGIPRERLAELFRPFAQLDSSPTRRFAGTGLGLAITRRLCEMMGGTVEVESAHGVGSTFTIRIPVRAPALPRPDAGAPG